MANDKKQLKATRTHNSAIPARRKKANATRQKKARRTSAKAHEDVDQQMCAVDELLETANQETADGASEIARGLRRKATQGSISAVKFLWDLANIKKAKSSLSESRFAAELFRLNNNIERNLKASKTAAADSPATQDKKE